MEDIYLKAPNFSEDNILGFNVGLRPYRKNGIRIEPEYLNNKLVIHNYGYGGSGITLCWGGAEETLRLLDQQKIASAALFQNKTVAVLGAGVIGMAVAFELLTHGYQVNIYADAFSPNTTSNVAAGILSGPNIEAHMSEAQIKLLDRMLAVSMQRFSDCANSAKPEFAGAKFLFDYWFEDKLPAAEPEKFKKVLTEEKLVRVHFDNGISKIGKQIRELGLEGKLFINDLYAKVQALGGQLHKRHFEDTNDIANLNESIIINCTSMGSRKLFNDGNFIPVRGHLVYLKPQEGIDYSLYHSVPQDPDFWVKIYPWSDRLILGGVFEKGIEDTALDTKIIQKLLHYARSCFN